MPVETFRTLDRASDRCQLNVRRRGPGMWRGLLMLMLQAMKRLEPGAVLEVPLLLGSWSSRRSARLVPHDGERVTCGTGRRATQPLFYTKGPADEPSFSHETVNLTWAKKAAANS